MPSLASVANIVEQRFMAGEPVKIWRQSKFCQPMQLFLPTIMATATPLACIWHLRHPEAVVFHWKCDWAMSPPWDTAGMYAASLAPGVAMRGLPIGVSWVWEPRHNVRTENMDFMRQDRTWTAQTISSGCERSRICPVIQTPDVSAEPFLILEWLKQEIEVRELQEFKTTTS